MWLWWWSKALPGPSVGHSGHKKGHYCVEETVNAAVAAAMAKAGANAQNESDDDVNVTVNIDNQDTQAQQQQQGESQEANGEGEMVPICHRPESGPPQTLYLPIQAAIAHLAEHPNDSWGACPVSDDVQPEPVAEETPVESVVDPTPEPDPVTEEPVTEPEPTP